MASWHDVAPSADFKPGSVRVVDLPDGTPVAVFNVDGRYLAIEDECTHEAEVLSWGQIEGETVVCPRHAARFSLVSGEALEPPAYEPVATFAVRVAAGIVQVAGEPNPRPAVAGSDEVRKGGTARG